MYNEHMLKLSYEEKIKIMESLNWDTTDSCEEMLAVVEGRLERTEAFSRDRLFVRSLERLPWHYITALWGIEAIKELYTPQNSKCIWPKERMFHFDFALAVLRREPLPAARWGIEYFKSKRHRFFSDRGNGS
jgi:hypothetical protein